MVGRTISHYRVLEKLGAGGMGEVYKALDERLERFVALKFLHVESAGARERRDRFLQEARAAAALDDPRICAVHDIDEVDGRLFIAMALVEGVSLEDRLREGPLPADEAVRIGTEILRGLRAAHRHGIVHRDIKSSNVMITPHGDVKILDFGLAEVADPTGATTITVGVGTPAYMSPEQLLGEVVDARTDIWSWGVVLYEMLSGRLPFGHEHLGSVVRAILRHDPEALDRVVPGVPGHLARIAERALAKRPAERYPDVDAVLADLAGGHAPVLGAGRDDRRPSIAVLPFADLSVGRDQGYFCEGLAQEIVNDLAGIRGLRVASRTSSFAYRARFEDVRDIGARLDVDSVLDGSVRRSGERLRVSVELVDVPTGFRVWGRRYDRDLRDVFAIQEEIAREIVGALRVELDERESRALGRTPPSDFEAFDLYLRGRQYFYRTKRQNLDFALDLFRDAARKDPEFGPAYAGMSQCYAYRCVYYGGGRADLERALEAGARAVELDPGRAECHASRGLALSLDHRNDEAERELETAIRLNPGSWESQYFYARLRLAEGRFEEAGELYAAAARADPEDYQSPTLLAMTYRKLGRLEDMRKACTSALANVEHHVRMHPDDARALYLRGQILVEIGRAEEGLDSGARALALAPGDPYIAYGMACIHARLGRTDDALRELEVAVGAGFRHREWIEKDPDLDVLRDHPRFAALLDRAAEPA